MKVIFLKDVPGSGLQGEIKEVADGYAINYLIPKDLAVPATEQSIDRLKSQKRPRKRKRQKLKLI